MSVLTDLGGLCLHQGLGTLVLPARKQQCEAGMGCVQSIKSGGIPGSAHSRTNRM